MSHRRRVRSLVLSLVLTTVALVPAAHGQSDEETQKVLQSIEWTNGPGEGDMSLARISVPQGYLFAGAKDTEKLMHLMQNPTSGDELGFIAPKDLSWFAVFEFSKIGYVKDDDGDKLDPDALLQSIREGTDAGNKERAKKGWSPFKVVGWEQKPRYNPSTHNLEWSIRGESEGSPVINHSTRLLGRNGVMEVSLVVDPGTLPAALPIYESLLRQYAFKSGERYAEYRQGDKVAKFGLAALITGGAAVAAAKSGILAKIMKFFGKGIILIVAAVAALWKRFFGKDRA